MASNFSTLVLRVPEALVSLVPTEIHVVLVEPEIHWNTGNVGRTCLAAGAQLHLVKPLGFSIDAKEVRRAGLDYWERVSPRVWDSFDDLALVLEMIGQPFFFTPDAPRSFWDVEYPEKTVLIFGRESTGFPPAIRAQFGGRTVRIPQKPSSVRSINLSSSVAIAIYEVLRRQSRSDEQAT